MIEKLLPFIPKDIRESILCYTLVDNRVIHSSCFLAVCSNNGYLYEIKNNKVSSYLNIKEEKASTISCCQFILKNILTIFYFVQTISNKLICVKKTEKKLEIYKTYKEVRGFEIYDFLQVGYPQVKVSFLKSSKDEIIELLFVKERMSRSKLVEVGDTESNSSSNIINALVNKLQMVDLSIDELTEEYNQISKLCFFDNLSECLKPTVVPITAVKFSSAFVNNPIPKIAVISLWWKIINDHCVIGLRVRNISTCLIPNIYFSICHENIANFVCTHFSLPEKMSLNSFGPSVNTISLKPDEEVFIVGAFRIPEFLLDSQLKIAYYLSSSSLPTYLKKGIIELNVLEIASKTLDWEEQFTVEDWMAITTLRTLTKVRIEAAGENKNKIESILLENLGFKKLKSYEENVFYCTSSYLKEVLLILKEEFMNPAVWKIHLYTSDDAQIFFLINAFYDLLPEKSTVFLDSS